MPSVGLVPNTGEGQIVRLLTNSSTGQENPRLRLYKNNVTPSSTMTIADYTEATFTGYSSVTLSSASWTVVEGDPTYAEYTSGVPFTCSGTTSELIYGFYLSSENSSTLLWSERFNFAPYTITYVGDALTPRPKIVFRHGEFLLEDGSGGILLEGSTGRIITE